jgi:hypothetical protein
MKIISTTQEHDEFSVVTLSLTQGLLESIRKDVEHIRESDGQIINLTRKADVSGFEIDGGFLDDLLEAENKFSFLCSHYDPIVKFSNAFMENYIVSSITTNRNEHITFKVVDLSTESFTSISKPWSWIEDHLRAGTKELIIT